MSEFDKMDQFFRNNLGEMKIEPREETWKRISYKLLWREIARFNFTNLSAGYFGIGGGAVLGVAVIFYLLLDPSLQKVNSRPDANFVTVTETSPYNQAEKTTEIVEPPVMQPALQIPVKNPGRNEKTDSGEPGNLMAATPPVMGKAVKDPTYNPVPANVSPDIKFSQETTEIPVDTQQPEYSDIQISGVHNPVIMQPARVMDEISGLQTIYGSSVEHPKADADEPFAIVEKTQTFPEKYTEPENPGVDNLTQVNASTRKTQSVSRINSFGLNSLFKSNRQPDKRSLSPGVPGKNRYGIESFFSSTAYVSSELMNYNTNGKNPVPVYLAGLSADYNILDYIIQSGIEIAVSNDESNYRIAYTSLDSTGFYWQPSGDSLIAVTVFDSVTHMDNKPVTNRYAYLNIPVSLSYRILGNNRWVGIARGGVTFSRLINKFEPELVYFKENATIQNIENETFKRYRNNFQISLGIQLRYLYSEKIDIFVESSYRKYLKSVYDSDAVTAQPYSVGIRGGFVIKF